MSDVTKQAVWDAAGKYHGNPEDTDELEAALKAHKSDESKAKAKTKTAEKADQGNGDDAA